jgi:PKD repeat protein
MTAAAATASRRFRISAHVVRDVSHIGKIVWILCAMLALTHCARTAPPAPRTAAVVARATASLDTAAEWPQHGRAPIPPTKLSLSLVATRTSGTAPLAVMFDATATTGPQSGLDPFRNIAYRFDFGDEHGEIWSITGASKNVESSGPIAAHVFERPGVYTVALTATNSIGTRWIKRTTITVLDPDTVYAGDKTVCISLTVDYTGCPAGAGRRQTMPTGTQWNGKRVLFKRGQDFSALAAISVQDGNHGVAIGAFGSGSAPQVASVGIGDWRPDTDDFASDIVVADLSTRGGMTAGVATRVLFLRNALTSPQDASSGFYVGDEYFTFDDPFRHVATVRFPVASELFFVENSVPGSIDVNANAFGFGARMAWLGNDFGASKYHNLRVVRGYKFAIAHNRMRGISSDGARHALKLHSGGLTAYDDRAAVAGRTWASRYGIVADNVFGSAAGNNPWTVAVAPQNSAFAEGIEDILVVGNRFVRGQNTTVDLILTGRRITYRDNVLDGGGTVAVESGAHGESLPADWNGPYYAH